MLLTISVYISMETLITSIWSTYITFHSFSGSQLCNYSLETRLKAEKPAQDCDISVLRNFFKNEYSTQLQGCDYRIRGWKQFRKAIRFDESEVISVSMEIQCRHFSENCRYWWASDIFHLQFLFSGATKGTVHNSSFSLDVREISKCTHIRKCVK